MMNILIWEREDNKIGEQAVGDLADSRYRVSGIE